MSTLSRREFVVASAAALAVRPSFAQTLRASDVVARYGGDEFVLILPGHDLKEGLEVAEAIRSAIRSATFLFRPYGFNEPALNLHGVITASLGLSSICSHATPGASVEQHKNELLRAADTALYRAKEHGKDRCTAASLEDARIPALSG